MIVIFCEKLQVIEHSLEVKSGSVLTNFPLADKKVPAKIFFQAKM